MSSEAEFYLKRVKEQIDYIEEVKQRNCDQKRKEEVLASAKGQLIRMYTDLGFRVIKIAK